MGDKCHEKMRRDARGEWGGPNLAFWVSGWMVRESFLMEVFTELPRGNGGRGIPDREAVRAVRAQGEGEGGCLLGSP
jgi:hypothetical protein